MQYFSPFYMLSVLLCSVLVPSLVPSLSCAPSPPLPPSLSLVLTLFVFPRVSRVFEIEIEEVAENTRPRDPCNCALIKIYVKLQSPRNCLDPPYEFQRRPLGVECELCGI
eukprot:COSAG05_NODE_1076_length_5956_cov_3.157418_1_plen_110_part_00